MASGKTTATRRSEAHLYLSKAEQFLEQARLALDAERFDAFIPDPTELVEEGGSPDCTP